MPKVKWTNDAIDDLERLDRQIARRILNKLRLINSRLFLFALILCIFICLGRTAHAKDIYILDSKTGAINLFGSEDFKLEKTFQIPKDLFFHKNNPLLPDVSDKIEINQSGNILYEKGFSSYDGRLGFLLKRLWLWDGEKEYIAEISYKINCFPDRDHCVENDTVSDVHLSADSGEFYWTINKIVGFKEEPLSYKLNIEVYRGHFVSGRLIEEQVAVAPFNECKCGTGVCSETCPVGIMITPEEGVKDFIKIQHFVYGQLGSSVEGYTYLEKKGNEWAETYIDKNRRDPVRPDIEIRDDTGCCGWVNNSPDVLVAILRGRYITIYDEWERFKNVDFDISFYVDATSLSKDYSKIAYVIKPSESGVEEYQKTGLIRFSAGTGMRSGTFDYMEYLKGAIKERSILEGLEYIKSIIDDFPLIEIKSIEDPSRAILTIKNAELAGWFDDNRVLVFKSGNQYIYDLTAPDNPLELPIKAESVEHIFIR